MAERNETIFPWHSYNTVSGKVVVERDADKIGVTGGPGELDILCSLSRQHTVCFTAPGCEFNLCACRVVFLGLTSLGNIKTSYWIGFEMPVERVGMVYYEGIYDLRTRHGEFHRIRISKPAE